MERKLTKEWEVSALNRETNEWTTTMNRAYEHVTDPKDYESIRATPAVIHPSRRKEVERDYDSIFVYGDAQIGYRRVLDYQTNEETLIPIHSEPNMRAMRMLARYVLPQLILNTGDNLDAPELSRFQPDSDHFFRTLSLGLQAVHNYYAELRSDHPNARILEVASNHNDRFNRTVLKQLPQMYGMMRPGEGSQYPVLTYPYMANLEHLGVEWIGGYPSGEYVHGAEYGRPPIVFRHGTETSQNGTTASKIMKNHPETHNVQGHDHSHSSASHTLRNGEQLFTTVVGTMANTSGPLPSYHNAVSETGQPVPYQENWNSTVLHIRDYRNGDYEFNNIIIRNGVGVYEGRVFDGNL